MHRIRVFLILSVLLGCLTMQVLAEEKNALQITDIISFSGGGLEDFSFLTDDVDTVGYYIEKDLMLHHSRGIGALSIVFDQSCTYYVRDTETGQKLQQGGSGFLHCFTDLEEGFGYAPKAITLEFPYGAIMCEIDAYSSGILPESVQRWEEPLTGGADIVLFSTHGDDEQLYFAGLLPYYAAERGLNVQVVYMTNHANVCGSERMHEMLNGLWAVGVRAYPVFGPFPDFKLPYKEATYLEYESLGYTRANLLSYVVENLRRFRPLVAVGHDLNGEYGHGMHKVYSDLLIQAVELSMEPEAFVDSAERYGVWDVPKTYLHLYGENQIVMDWDQPLEAFHGMTAFEVNQKLGFPCHISQQYDQYVNWLYGSRGEITRASEIYRWSPCHFGLYRSTVGEDQQKNDFMENLTSYGELCRMNEERVDKLRAVVEKARLEQEKESQLLRPVYVEEIQETVEETREFPVLWCVILAASGILFPLVFFVLKKFEKK